MMTVEDIVKELGQLSPEQIAQRFKELKITGKRSWAPSCPLSNYVRVITGYAFWQVATEKEKIVFSEEQDKPLINGLSLPLNLKTFVGRFDMGSYDYLENKD